MEQAVVSAVVPDTSEAKITVGGVSDEPGIAAGLFRKLAEAAVNVDMIVQNVSAAGVTDISFTVPKEEVETASKVASDQMADDATVEADDSIGRVSLVGAGMKSNPGVALSLIHISEPTRPY